MRSKLIGAVTWTVVVLVVATAAVLGVPRLLGGATLTILTGSMQPTLRPGDVVAVVPTDPAGLRVGDVVTFQPVSGDPTLVTHRLVAIDDTAAEARFVTRGDANTADDAPLVAEQIQGRVVYVIPFIGWARQGLGSAGPLLVAVSGAALVAWGAFAVLRPGARPLKRKTV
jgi:signal peptidase